MDVLVGNGLDTDELRLNNHNISTFETEHQFSPFLAKLFLQENYSLTMLPPSLFQHMPVLQVLDLSHTSIQSLPPSIFKLSLLEEFILRECSLLMELPPQIGALKKLKFFDLEGTELMYLPKEIGKLETLECLRVSLSTYADDQKDRSGIEHILPRKTISKLTKLKELSISVNADAEWWEVELLEGVMGDLIYLPDLKTVKLYLPTAKALQEFLSLERYQVPIYSNLWNFRFMIGHCEELPCSVQLDIEEKFLNLERCVKFMNGDGYTDETAELIRNARALYLRRHWTIGKLPIFDMKRVKYCLLMDCNEMQTLVDQEDVYAHLDKATNDEDEILTSLQYLGVHFMKKLQRLSKG
ncbi:WRKY domain-containing protein [Tanacetum coccineum]|uniref:WRKY domain-containing protein n=1 Tax=Tanacetum coccineum TaxID=301880 RepID=A0ABQ4XBB6_9ASTR